MRVFLARPTPPLKPTEPGPVSEKFFATGLPKNQQKQLPRTGGDPTSPFTLGAGVLLVAGGMLAHGVLARKLTK